MKFKTLNPNKWPEPTYEWKYQSTPLELCPWFPTPCFKVKVKEWAQWSHVLNACPLHNSENIYSKTCVKRPLSKRPIIVFKADYRLMQVKSIAECSLWSILQYFRASLIYQLSLRPMFCLFFEWPFTQVLLYTHAHLNLLRKCAPCYKVKVIVWGQRSHHNILWPKPQIRFVKYFTHM